MSESERYSRQVRFAPIGEAGQARLSGSSVVIVGLGALGSVVADQLTRAGVGRLTLIDRDFVELSNLQRQTLYDEEDVRLNLPKAVAAEKKLGRINSTVEVEVVVDDLNPSNVEEHIDGADLVLDAVDNFETRFVLNDACRKLGLPWIYSAAVGSYGLVLPILPESACLRCVVDELPAPGSSPTCDTAGVIAPITNLIASIEVTEALRILVGAFDPGDVRLISVDVWERRFHTLRMSPDLRKSCPLCAHGRFDYLDGNPVRTITLCGRNAVQLIPGVRAKLDLAEMGKTLEVFGPVQTNEFLLKCQNPPYELTLFHDGRAIIKGTEKASTARSVYSKMVGL